jgi:NAD(P)-dependent dehydrogenase (short-subunit alcohol dehydrogenase family)
MTIRDRKAIITGGFGALGFQVGRFLAEGGAKVALIDRAPAAPPEHEFAVVRGNVDLTDPRAATAAVDEVAAALGGLDALLNIAGAFRWETVEAGSVETWDFLYAANVKTALCASKAAIPHLTKSSSGSIVNIGALAAARAGEGMGAYAASKSAVARLTEALAEEQKKNGIRVNAILPSIIDTPANRKDMPKADFTKWISPREIAELAGFLISEAARGVNGALIAAPGRV